MADEELDAGLVERAAAVTWERLIKASSAPVATMLVAEAETHPSTTKAAFCAAVKSALLSLPIPAAALNALARGEATVVSRTAVTQAGNVLFNLKQRMPGSKLQEPDLRSMSEVSALLDASPYAAKE